MRDDHGVGAADDLILFVVAILAFSLFFASLAAAYVLRASEERGLRLQETADSLLAAMRDGPNWTVSRGVLLAAALDSVDAEDLAPWSGGHAFRVTVWDVVTGSRWDFESGIFQGDLRAASTSANVVADRTDPARITATVWSA
ncbi:MAG TPA: hypothetical protein VGR51_01220 [Thermoplasmata archaeon]|jgi:hypothetical protein|nr:hypothetical protein [Thermoplasmata archaeon]